MGVNWRLLLDPPGSAAYNMSVDEALLEHAGATPPTLRLYTWRAPSISLGYRQSAPAWLARCASRGVEVVRRITGGGAVVHAGDLTYAVVSGVGQGALPQDLRGSYDWIRSLLLKALQDLGLRVAQPQPKAGSAALDVCFAGATGYEIELAGRKLIGSAQRRTARGLLQHGSIRLSDDGDVYREILRIEPPARPVLPPLKSEEIAGAIVDRWQRETHTGQSCDRLTAAERESALKREAIRAGNVLCVPPVASSRFPQSADRLP